MGSLIAGWILFALGIVLYGIAIWGRVRKLLAPRQEALDLSGIEDAAEAIAKLAQALSKFSEDIQFAILGTGCIAAGLYLLAHQPF
jgi:hypothetical protein